MASLSLPSLRIPHLESQFLGESRFSLINSPYRQSSRIPKAPSTSLNLKPTAKFNLLEVMGGRGLLNGESGLQLELQRTVETPGTTGTPSSSSTDTVVSSSSSSSSFDVPENAFDKELLGLTGGFPGGEKGLQSFIEKNPPRNRDSDSDDSDSDSDSELPLPSTKPKAPELPLLMPGMIAIVKNPKNPFYMYCGIVQRITDGKAGVLFEGGNWDKLITFRLDELQRREKGPPMVNPKSAVIESMLPKESSSHQSGSLSYQGGVGSGAAGGPKAYNVAYGLSMFVIGWRKGLGHWPWLAFENSLNSFNLLQQTFEYVIFKKVPRNLVEPAHILANYARKNLASANCFLN